MDGGSPFNQIPDYNGLHTYYLSPLIHCQLREPIQGFLFATLPACSLFVAYDLEVYVKVSRAAGGNNGGIVSRRAC